MALGADLGVSEPKARMIMSHLPLLLAHRFRSQGYEQQRDGAESRAPKLVAGGHTLLSGLLITLMGLIQAWRYSKGRLIPGHPMLSPFLCPPLLSGALYLLELDLG